LNRVTESELRAIARVSFDVAQEPRESVGQSLAASASRLAYFFMLCAAVAIAYVIARALLA
jgi:hypothetical protein